MVLNHVLLWASREPESACPPRLPISSHRMPCVRLHLTLSQALVGMKVLQTVTTVTADAAERLLPVCPELAASCTLFCVTIISSLQLIKVKCNVLTCPRTQSDGVTPFLGLGGSFAR